LNVKLNDAKLNIVKTNGLSRFARICSCVICYRPIGYQIFQISVLINKITLITT